MIGKLQKLTLLSRVIPFLEEDDVNRFAATSKALRKLVFSPMGFKIISVSRTKIMAKNFQDRVLDKVSMSKREKPQSLSMLGGNATS